MGILNMHHTYCMHGFVRFSAKELHANSVHDTLQEHTHQAMGDDKTRYEYRYHKEDPPQDVPSRIPAARCTHPLRQGITEMHRAL